MDDKEGRVGCRIMLKNDFGPKEDPMLGSIVILLISSKKNSYFM